MKNLVLLHGFPLKGALWAAQMEALQGRCRVLAPDLLGTADSMDGMARAVLARMDAVGVQRAAVAGHSMGGYVALALWRLAAERVAGLGLICTQAGDDSPEARQGRFASAEKLLQEGPGVVAGAMAPRLFAPGVRPESAAYRAAERMMQEQPPEAVRAALFAMAGRSDMRPHLGGIGVPTLVLTGAEDRLIPVDRSREMAAAIPGARLVIVPDAGHMPMLEQPEAVSRALLDWLQAVE